MRSRVQRFELRAQLGAGGMGTVFRAFDPQLERDVAIKLLTTAVADVRAELSAVHTVDLRVEATPAPSSLLAEARVMARLSHPNVVPVYEVGLDGGDVFVVMELVEGETLRDWLDVPRATAEILAVFAQALRGLGAAHARGIIHRDFKPDNVLIGRDGRVRVADFGLSRMAAGTAPGNDVALGGTPKYMAPELWTGAAPTAAADVFAACRTLAEAFGAPPGLAAPERTAALRARDVPAPVIAAIEAGLADDPAARPTVADLEAALAPRAARGRARTIAIATGAVAATAAGVALVLALGSTDAERAACPDDATLLAGRWDAAVRGRLRARLAATSGDAERVLAAVDRRAAELVAARRAVCEDAAAGTLTAAQAARRASCIERRAIELGRSADVFVRPDAATVTASVEETLLAITPATCAELELPALGDRATIEQLYARYVRTMLIRPPRDALIDALAAIETDAAAAGDPELAVRAGVVLGIQQRNADRIAQSAETLERAHRRAREIKSANLEAIVLGERSATALRANDQRAARSFAQLAHELVDRADIPVRTRARIYRALGRAELIRGDYPAAVELLRKALDLLATRGERYAEIEIAARMDLTDALLIGQGKRDEALALALETAARAKQLLGPRAHGTALALNQVGKAYQHHRQLEQSLAYRREALAIIAAETPPTSEVLFQRAEVAQTLQYLNRTAEARAAFERLVAEGERDPAVAQYLAFWRERLARAVYESGEYDDGIARFEAAVQQAISEQGAAHPRTLRLQAWLAELMIDAGKLDPAARIVAIVERGYAASTAADARKRLAMFRGTHDARLRLFRGQAREAERRSAVALAALRELGARDVELVQPHVVHGRALVALARFADAHAELTAARAVLVAEHVREDQLALVDVGLARAAFGLGKRDEAIALAEQARDVLARYPGQPAGRRDVAAFLATAKR